MRNSRKTRSYFTQYRAPLEIFHRHACFYLCLTLSIFTHVLHSSRAGMSHPNILSNLILTKNRCKLNTCIIRFISLHAFFALILKCLPYRLMTSNMPFSSISNSKYYSSFYLPNTNIIFDPSPLEQRILYVMYDLLSVDRTDCGKLFITTSIKIPTLKINLII